MARAIGEKPGGVGFSGASFSSQDSKSWWSPDSSSLMKTLAVICIGLQSNRPSWMPLSRRHLSTWSVILMNALRVEVSNQSSLRYDFMDIFSWKLRIFYGWIEQRIQKPGSIAGWLTYLSFPSFRRGPSVKENTLWVFLAKEPVCSWGFVVEGWPWRLLKMLLQRQFQGRGGCVQQTTS